jgi:hypothetical protein
MKKVKAYLAKFKGSDSDYRLVLGTSKKDAKTQYAHIMGLEPKEVKVKRATVENFSDETIPTVFDLHPGQSVAQS